MRFGHILATMPLSEQTRIAICLIETHFRLAAEAVTIANRIMLSAPLGGRGHDAGAK
jgi:hypothetical protein